MRRAARLSHKLTHRRTARAKERMAMKLWGGRFEKATDGMVDDFHSSISFDKRLYRQDILGYTYIY